MDVATQHLVLLVISWEMLVSSHACVCETCAHVLQPVTIYMCTLEEAVPPGIRYSVPVRKKAQVTQQITTPVESAAGCLVKAACIMHAVSL